ncbi:hypothetical protein BD309DRAFT_1014582 [Dichomitus squalens]|nr:hypothetical protein BD309DRAFT_1014582 [Dichomitus squalens]
MSPSPGWSTPTPSNVSPASLEQSYAGLLSASTFSSLTVAQRAAAFPSKYSFAEVAAFVRAVDEEAKKEELSIGKALDCIAACTGVRCGTTNFNAVRMNLKRGNYELWREFIDASPMRLGSYSNYKNRVKKLPPLSSLDWTSFPQEQKPVSAGPILVPADVAASASMMVQPFQFTFMCPIPTDFPGPADIASFIDDCFTSGIEASSFSDSAELAFGHPSNNTGHLVDPTLDGHEIPQFAESNAAEFTTELACSSPLWYNSPFMDAPTPSSVADDFDGRVCSPVKESASELVGPDFVNSSPLLLPGAWSSLDGALTDPF